MKADYTKPLFAMESFSPLQTTARDCVDNIPKDQLTMNEPGTCKWDLGGGTSIFVPTAECTIDGTYMDDVGCYNNPSEGNYIFRS